MIYEADYALYDSFVYDTVSHSRTQTSAIAVCLAINNLA